MKRRIPLGRCISPTLCRLSTITSGFFTVYDGDMEKYFQDFADKTSFVFDALFPHVEGAPPTPVAKNAQAFYQWGLDNNYPPIGFYSAYPGLSVQDIRALLADRKSTGGDRLIALGVAWSRTMSQPRVRRWPRRALRHGHRR